MDKSDNGGIHVAAAAAAAGTMMATGLPLAGVVGAASVYAGKYLLSAYKAAPSQKEIEGHDALSPGQFGPRKYSDAEMAKYNQWYKEAGK